MVEHTDQAVGNFDAITYEKGAAVIKQLVAAIGDDAFRAGLQRYFERHAWGNASLADFLAALGQAAGEPLDEWARLWLQTPSLNTIGVPGQRRRGRIIALEVAPGSAAGAPRPAPARHDARPGRTGRAGGAAGRPGPSRSASAARALTVPEAAGRPAPLFVYPDLGDHDYALVETRPAVAGLRARAAAGPPDPLLRQQVWSTLYEMVRAAALRPGRLPAAVAALRPGEADRGTAWRPSWSGPPTSCGATCRRTPRAKRLAPLVALAIEAACAPGAADLRLTWARAAIAMAADPADVDLLLGLADAWLVSRGLGVDQEMRWSLAVKAVAHGLEGASAPLRGRAATRCI